MMISVAAFGMTRPSPKIKQRVRSKTHHTSAGIVCGCDWWHVSACVQSLVRLGARIEKPRPGLAKCAGTGTGRVGLPLSPRPPVIITIAVAITIGVVSFAVSALVAFAVRVFVVVLVAHPVFKAARVFPVIVLEFEAAAATGVVLSGALAVAITVLEAVLAGLVVTVVIIVVIVPAPGLAPSHSSKGQRNHCAQERHSNPTHHPLSQHTYLQMQKPETGKLVLACNRMPG